MLGVYAMVFAARLPKADSPTSGILLGLLLQYPLRSFKTV